MGRDAAMEAEGVFEAMLSVRNRDSGARLSATVNQPAGARAQRTACHVRFGDDPLEWARGLCR